MKLIDIFIKIKSHKVQAKAISSAFSVSILNQMVSSGTNFLMGLYLVHTLTPMDFGLYGIGFSIILFYAGVGNALFLVQMVVYMPDKASDDRLRYAASIFWGVIAFCIITLIVIGSGAVLIKSWWEWEAPYNRYFLSIFFASIMYLLKDFFIRHAYNIRQEVNAVILHSSIAIFLLFLILITKAVRLDWSAETALWFFGLAHAISVIVGLSIMRLPLRDITLKAVFADVREAWFGGRWGIATNIILWLRTQAHVYLSAVLLGPVGVAQLNAARLLVTPAVILLPSLSLVLFPRFAELRVKNCRALLKLSTATAAIMLFIAISYSGLLMLSLDKILTVVFNNKYTSLTSLVFAWCIFVSMTALTEPGKMVIQVLKNFRFLFLINIAALCTLLASVIVFFPLLELKGMIYSLVLSEVVMVICIWALLSHNSTFVQYSE